MRFTQNFHSDEFEEIAIIYKEIRRKKEETINFNIDSGKEEKEEEDNQSIIILKEFFECFNVL